MFPFWELVIEPTLDATGVTRLVEIGALRGETTIRMLERLGPDAELHVIDPVPEFDPAEHEKAFPGRYIFHRDLSLNVLPTLPPVDAALIDGDHNWYTVYGELKALGQVALDHDAPLPVMIMHDVCWPYGRRDLYYSPETIPDEFRQPYQQKGMAIGRGPLLNNGGLNPTMYNAVDEGGPRNGVMTGLDDFVAEWPKPLRVLVLPIYFGLAIVVEEERLARQPELAAVLDRLETADGRADLLDLSEDVRLRAMMFQHAVFYQSEKKLDRAARRYLDLLKGALLDEHYLENELRIQHIVKCMQKGTVPTGEDVRDPFRVMKNDAEALKAARHSGRLRNDAGELISYFPYTDMGRVRLDHLETCLDTVRTEKVAGDLVECGTRRGGGAMFLRGYLDAHELIGSQVWVVDSFRGSPAATDTVEVAGPVPSGGPGFPELQADLNLVRDGFDRFDLLDDRVRFLQGEPGEILVDAPIEKVALVRIGGDLGEVTADVLDDLYDKISLGGFIVIDDYVEPSCNKVVDEFRARRGIDDPIERIDWAGVFWRKMKEPSPPDAPTDEPAPSGGGLLNRLRRPRADRAGLESPARAAGAPLATPNPPTARKDLSVVVVFYNMKREAARTLHSLSRSYQHEVDGLDYEVIVVDNGSAPDQRLDEAYVRSFGPEFRFIDLAGSAQPSPVFALNEGVKQAGGAAVALMIDGAHVLSPGVLHYGMAGLSLYEPAIVATQQWYVGPGQQGDAMFDGYDQTFEDRLFDEISWPRDGYGLFQISHFIGERDWFDGIWESNCIFVPRALLAQVGAFDESFVMPGGGFANLEFYERLGSTPGVSVTTILGEGSFHQVHGGTTTNQPEIEQRRNRISSYAQHFDDIRGRKFRGPGKKIHYVGTMFNDAARTKSRRKTAPNLFQKGAPGDPDAMPTTPEPIFEELQLAYTEAFWRNLAWKRTSWMGHRVAKSPSDLLTYQEIIHDVRPDWAIEMRTGDGGRAYFLATICEMIGHGQVLSIDDRFTEGLPQHPRLTYLTVASTHGEETGRKVREIVGAEPNALVMLGTRGGKRRMVEEFETLQDLIPVGSYAIIEDTIFNGHPVWPSFGAGPWEAAKDILQRRSDFIADLTREKYTLSFNPGGFLKRMA